MNVAIFGLGLIGGSIGRSLVKYSDYRVFGQDIDNNTVLKAVVMGAIHEQVNDDNIRQADIVILALCPSDAISIMHQIVGKLKKGCIVADCCGNKRRIVAEMKELSKVYDVDFIGMHPMAGREFSGLSHSTVGLFERSYIILIPVHTDIDSVLKLKELISYLGCDNVVISEAEKHDKIIAYTSQLAHVVSSAYIKNPLSALHVGYSAGSFRDMTRVAKLNPDMWTELFLENRDNLVEQIDILQQHIAEYRTAIANNDSIMLRKLLADGVIMKENAENARKAGVVDD